MIQVNTSPEYREVGGQKRSELRIRDLTSRPATRSLIHRSWDAHDNSSEWAVRRWSKASSDADSCVRIPIALAATGLDALGGLRPPGCQNN